MLRRFGPVHAVYILASLTVAAIVVSSTVLLLDLRNRELKHAQLETESLTRMFMEQTEQNFESADLILRGIQERMSSAYGRKLLLDGMPVRLLMGSRASGMRHLRSLFVVDAAGMVVNTTRPEGLNSVSVADRDYFRVFAEGRGNELYIAHPVQNRSFGVWTLHLSRPLFSETGHLLGIIVAAFDVNHFEQLYSFLKLDFDRPIAIYLADGTLVASVPHREELIGTHAPELLDGTIPAVGGEVRVVEALGQGHEGQKLSVGRLLHFPLAVSVRNDESEALVSWRDTAIPIGAGATLVCLFTALVAGLLARELQREASLAKALGEAKDRYRHTVESVMDAIIAIDETHQIVLFNPAAEHMFGYPASAVLGQTMGLMIPQPVRVIHHAHIDQFMKVPLIDGALQRQLQVRGVRANGEEFPIETTISKTSIGGRIQMTAVLRDITQHQLNEANLRDANQQLRDLYSSMQSVREEERKRIARELHDELGQQLTGLKLDMSWLNTRLKEGRAPTADKMDGMRHLLDETIASVRRISSDLRPLILDDLGFGEAVKWQVQEIAKRGHLDAHLNLNGADLVNDPGVSTALFRIVQESLTNVLKHSGATQVEIDLTANEDHLILSIRDNGKGLQRDARPHGIGLLNMRERALSLGGQFQVQSSPSEGTTILVTVPLHLATKMAKNT